MLLALVSGVALLALQQTRHTEQTLYAADMIVVQQALADTKLVRARQLLEAYQPSHFWQEDLRGFEWRYFWRLCRDDKSLATLEGDQSQVNSVAFAPRGTAFGPLLASGSQDGAIRLWRLSERAVMQALGAGPGGIHGSILASPEPTMLSGGGPVLSVAFSANGRWLAAGCGDIMKQGAGTITLWDIGRKLKQPVWTAKAHNLATRCVAFSRDGRWLATAR